MGVALEDEQQDDGEAAQDHDAVGEHQAVALGGELTWDEPVAGEEEREAREVGERRVGRQEQDQHRHELDLVIEAAAAEDVARQLRDDRLVGGGNDTEVVGEVRDAEKERDEDDAEPGEDDTRVARFRRLEGGHAVRDGLDAGQRGAARGEGAQEQEEPDALEPVRMRLVGRLAEEVEDGTRGAVGDEREQTEDEEVRRRREELPGLPDAAQVDDGHDHHRRHAQHDAVAEQPRHRRGDGGDAGRDAHRHREHVIDQEGGAGDQRGVRPQVVLGDDVRPAAFGVGADRLTVRGHDDGDEGGDGDADRQRVGQRRRAGEDQHEQDFLGGVRGGGERVGGEDGEGGGLGEAFVPGLCRR